MSVAGLTYVQTVSPSGVTSNNVPRGPSSMSVFPFGRRTAPEIKLEKKSAGSAAAYVHIGSAGP